jgi:hypothetical protein
MTCPLPLGSFDRTAASALPGDNWFRLDRLAVSQKEIQQLTPGPVAPDVWAGFPARNCDGRHIACDQ